MKLTETVENDTISLHIDLETSEKVRYPSNDTKANFIIISVYVVILLVWIIRNDGLPGSTPKEAFYLVVVLALVLFTIINLANIWLLSNPKTNKLCHIEINTSSKTLRMKPKKAKFSVNSVVTLPKKIAILREGEKLENFKDLIPIFYDKALDTMNSEKYLDLVESIAKRVSELLEVPINKFNQ